MATILISTMALRAVALLEDAHIQPLNRFLLERHSLKQRDPVADLGGESVVSGRLSGKRKLNASHIELLSKRFHIFPAVFSPM